MGWGGGVVAHKILVTCPEAKFLFSLLGLFGALGFGLGLGLVNRNEWTEFVLTRNGPGPELDNNIDIYTLHTFILIS